MATSAESVIARLANLKQDDTFAILADIATLTSESGVLPVTTELVIRALDHWTDFEREQDLLLALAREHGLFPYIEATALRRDRDIPLRDLIALEMHRPEHLDSVVFHRVQAQVYERLRQGENVILSAPTSFGKSLIIDALIASGTFTNAVIVVPTLALMDETRRRLSRFGDYRLITHPGQSFSARNLLIVTQERLLAFSELPPLEFFFLDEFYKLAETGPDGALTGRAVLLNQALRQLLQTGAQFYLAGPSIQGLDLHLAGEIRAAFIRTDYSTVAADVVRITAQNDSEREKQLVQILRTTDEPTLIYCQSPARVRQVVRWIMSANLENQGAGMSDAADWLAANYHARWFVVRALSLGIGVHHGRLPRWLAQTIVQGFNEGQLGVLICTNSLIEGVNTRAKNIIILDKKIATSAYDFFTFANIKGRAGRMLKHFIGKVFLFHPEPEQTLPSVDIPGLTQSELAPPALLLTIDSGEQTVESRQRVRSYEDQDLLPVDVLKSNASVDPDQQLSLAKFLLQMTSPELRRLAWTTPYPSYEQLLAATSLIWTYLPPEGFRSHGAVSPEQLTYLTRRVASVEGEVKAAIEIFLSQRTSGPIDTDAQIESALDFLRFWIGFNLPSTMGALDRILRVVLEKRGLASSDYSAFAARLESGFRAPAVLALEEYGIPAEVTTKLLRYVGRYESLDELLERLGTLPLRSLRTLSAFERTLVVDALEAT